ncbi:MAG: type II 3-dehydroquinate dehydratase [Clostridia bacterium]|nr:type II 3-dehydroquinate dehydratase [Clostridia bacterium]
MKILVINGPNLDLLGIREPEIYGSGTYRDLEKTVYDAAERAGVEVEIFRSNHEGAIVDRIGEAYGKIDGIVINPAAYTHTSVAIRDALSAVAIPAVEVHISDVSKREPFRQISYVRDVCVSSVVGHGLKGYAEAIGILCDLLNKKSK